MFIEKQDNKEQILLDISGDKQKLSHAEEKSANSLLGRARDRITTNINPYNRGVSDFSSEKEFKNAFSKAKNNGEDEFIRNGERYNTKLKNLPGQRIRERDDFSENWFSPIGTGSISGRAKEYDKMNMAIGDLYRYYMGSDLKSKELAISTYKPSNSKDINARYIAV